MKFGTINHKLKAASNCWICEGWSSVKFMFTPKTEIDVSSVQVKLHLSTDDFKGEVLECLVHKPGEPQIYMTERMLAPGDATFYFTVGGEV